MKTMLMRLRFLGLAAVLSCVAAGVMAAPSFAKGPLLKGPLLKVFSAEPNFMSNGDKTTGYAFIENVGDEATSGTITLVDTPSVGLVLSEPNFRDTSQEYPPLSGPTTCELAGSEGRCSLTGSLSPGAYLKVEIPFSIAAESGTLTNLITVSGGGTGGVATYEHRITVGLPGSFGLTESSVSLLDAAGAPAGRAASDPADFTTTIKFVASDPKLFPFPGSQGIISPLERFKDVTAHLPAGFVGNPTVAPVCTAAGLLELIYPSYTDNCPVDSQVGIARISFWGGFYTVRLYNMETPPGSATQLGFNVTGVGIVLNARLRPGDNGIDVASIDTSTTLPVTSAEVTTWGVPADKSHDPYRGECMKESGPSGRLCPTTAPRKAFLRMPTSCSGEPLAFGASANSYEHPDVYAQASLPGPTLSGCDLVPFAPEITVFPTGTAANSPTGVSVRVSLPQNSNPDGLAEADLKKAVVTLPEGMAINPSAADGLQACTDAQLREGLPGPAECPDGSKVGTVLLHTPLLAEPIEGNVYIMSQQSSDPESGEMFRIAMELRNDQRGIDIKVTGHIRVSKNTGQLTTTFDNNPQLPFSDITLSFKAGARAPLTTPVSCEPQTTEADLFSWAQPGVAVHRANSFSLTSGPEGTPCVAQQGFNPGFNTGVSSVQAGGFTPFLATFTRRDADQSMQRVSVKMPQGLLGSLVGLPLCPEAQANAGTCSQASEIGTVTAGAGSGPTPFYVTGGHVYMTGPYEGAPFGLSVVVPTKAGPYNLGNVVVRSKVEVDPHTAQLTVTTDPLPQIVGGVPVNLRLVNVTINRPNFTYNPTNCDPMSVSGTITGGQGAVAQVSNHFQVTNCGALKFRPRFTVWTSGKTSRADGASLTAKLSYPVSQGTEANIAKVKVSLPKQLPSRLTTLQKACAAATFETDPAACPAASRIGMATASTPVLPVTLSGPVYFVSHGGEAFPNLVIVLQGYNVTVDLVGDTFINKAGITSTTFKTVPDVPVGSFELKLPQGPDSALAANSNLCNAKLRMPTVFVAQDGAEIRTSTPIAATGCAKKAHKASRRHHKGKHHNRKGKRK